MKNFIFITVFFVSIPAWSQMNYRSAGAGMPSFVSFQPVYGVENVTKVAPEPVRSVTRVMYGGRVLLGSGGLQFEAEYTQGRDNESLPDSDISITDNVKRYRAGLRLNYGNQFASIYMRAGYQRTERERRLSDAGVSTNSVLPVRETPYAGAGLSLRLAQILSLDLGANLSQGEKIGDDRKYNIEYQAALSFRFGNR